jgi:hypothetical protein
MRRLRFIAVGAVVGIAWASSLRAFMMVLAGADSDVTFIGTFGTIIPAGLLVGALLGWAEYQRRIGQPYRWLIGSPLLVAIIPTVTTAELDTSPISLAAFAMIAGYSLSGRGPRWIRIVAGTIALSVPVAAFVAPKGSPDLSLTTARGAWFATLSASLFICLGLASAIPMLRAEPRHPVPANAE